MRGQSLIHKLICRFVTTTKKKKKEIPDLNLDTACPAGIPCNQYPIVPVYSCVLSDLSFDWKRGWG